MPIEFKMLVFSIILGLVHITIAVTAATLQRGLRWALSPRDAILPPLTGTAGRLDRASWNFLETFPFFGAAIFLLYALGHFNAMTALGAQCYFWARVAYIPAYAFGIILVRTVIWSVAMAGIILILVGIM